MIFKFPFLFITFFILISSFYEGNISNCSIVTNTNYLDLEYITIANIQGTCRYCKELISQNSYRFGQCAMIRKSTQRFHIIRGNNCNTYSIMSADDLQNTLLSFQNNFDFEIINVNVSGGVVIKVYNQNLCLTNNILDSIIPPYQVTENQLFTSCQIYNSDEKQIFYFNPYVYLTNNSNGCKSETSAWTKFSFFETTKSVIIDSSYLLDLSDITIIGMQNYSYQVSNSNITTEFFLWLEISNSYSINYIVKDTLKYQLIANNFDILNNNQHYIVINIEEKIREANVNFINFSTIQLVDNSDVILHNLIINEDYTHNIGSIGLATFSIWLYYGNYNLSVAIKSPNYFEFDNLTSTSLPIVVDNSKSNPFAISISIVEKIAKLTVNLINYTSSVIADNTNIKFTNLSIGGDYNKNVGVSLGFSTFDINLHYGDYSLTFDFKNPLEHMLDSSIILNPIITISSRTDRILNITILSVPPPIMRYKFNGNLYNEISASTDITSIFPFYTWSTDTPKSSLGWDTNSLYLNSKKKYVYGLNWVKKSGYANYSGLTIQSGLSSYFLNLFIVYPSTASFSYVLEGYLYTKNLSGTFGFFLRADDEAFLYLDTFGTIVSKNCCGDSSASGTANLNADTYYYIRIYYSDIDIFGVLDIAITPPGLSQTYSGDGFLRTAFDSDIRLPSINLSNSYSFMFWIKVMSGNNSNDTIFQFKENSSGKNIGLVLSGSSIIAIRRNSVNENSSIVADINIWSHICLILEIGSNIKLVKNKTQIFISSSFIHDASNNFTASSGNLGWNVDRVGESLLSKFKDFRVYGIALTQIMIDYNYDE